MKSIHIYAVLCAMSLISSGCNTPNLTPEERAQMAAQREDRRNQSEARSRAEEEADRKREAEEQRRDEERELREKFARYSTGELKLMDARYKDLQKGASGRDLNIRINSRSANSEAKNVERILEIERELLRRWKSGDKDAYLPEFDTSKESNPK